MKKKIPSLINVKLPGHISYEKLHINTLNEDAKNGYEFTEYDRQLYCAILIKENGVESLTEDVKNYCIKEGKLIDNIRFKKIRLEKVENKYIEPDDNLFYLNHLKQKVAIREAVIRKEIIRTGFKIKKLFDINSNYLKTLLSFVRKIDDEIVLIRGVIHIKLSFEKCVHIFIKHVEETKFAPGPSPKRIFFNYEFEEIFTLLNVILRQEEVNIKNHFLKVAVGKNTGQQELVKDYINNWINYNNDIFALAIDANGYITKFHQKN